MLAYRFAMQRRFHGPTLWPSAGTAHRTTRASVT